MVKADISQVLYGSPCLQSYDTSNDDDDTLSKTNNGVYTI